MVPWPGQHTRAGELWVWAARWLQIVLQGVSNSAPAWLHAVLCQRGRCLPAKAPMVVAPLLPSYSPPTPVLAPLLCKISAVFVHVKQKLNPNACHALQEKPPPKTLSVQMSLTPQLLAMHPSHGTEVSASGGRAGKDGLGRRWIHALPVDSTWSCAHCVARKCLPPAGAQAGQAAVRSHTDWWPSTCCRLPQPSCCALCRFVLRTTHCPHPPAGVLEPLVTGKPDFRLRVRQLMTAMGLDLLERVREDAAEESRWAVLAWGAAEVGSHVACGGARLGDCGFPCEPAGSV